MLHKLYSKNKLCFALLWILLYVVGTSTADELSRRFGIEKSITLPWLLLLVFFVVLWLKKHRMTGTFGLCAPSRPASSLLYYLPLVLMASCNLWYGISTPFGLSETVFYICSMLCVGFLEELIFRGFLFKAMAEDNLRAAAIVSSLTFGMGHIVNLFNGSGMNLLPNLCQIIYAAAAGLLFVLLFLKTESLWPCILTHSILNALSAFSNPAAMTNTQTLLSSLLLTGISLGYAVWLCRQP